MKAAYSIGKSPVGVIKDDIVSYETEIEIGLKENAASGLARLGGLLLGLDHNASGVAKSLQGLIGKGNEAKEAMRLLKIAALGVAEIEIGKKMIASLALRSTRPRNSAASTTPSYRLARATRSRSTTRRPVTSPRNTATCRSPS